MDDIGLATGASPEIGRLYNEAKAFSGETPVLALSFLRGLAVAFCKTLDRDLEGQTLDEKILNLKRQGLLKPHALKLLRVLQINGNKGAHPESYDFVTLDFPALVGEALVAARSLIEHLYLLRDGTVPAYETAPVESGALKEMCIRAMLERDVHAMNQAGEFFQERADREPKTGVVLSADGYPFSARADIDQAMFWFKQAASAHNPNAMYQYGHYLTQHYKVDKDRLSEGERYIARAAQENHPDALVYVGNASLEGNGIFVKDEVYAREVFMDAARQGHPMAWSQLGAMNTLGVGGAADKELGASYTLEAAKAGIPQAQYNLFVLYLEGVALPKDEAEGIRHLQDAAAQGHPAAVYNLATFIEVGRVPDRMPGEAEAEYERAMEYREYRARSALYAAQLIELRSEAMTDLLRAARHLQTCYSEIDTGGDPHSLRAECLSTCEKVVGRIRDHLNINGPNHSLKADDIFTSALFDKNCVPVIDLEARFQYLWGVISGFDPTAVTSNSEFLLREACLTPRPARPGAGWKSPITLHRRAKETAIPRPSAISRAHEKVGRNERCPCGSGDKYKKCHGS